jgi:nitrogen-specific signal transduction histidine kinase
VLEEDPVIESDVADARSIAHELKNPLGAAKGALELVLDESVLGSAEDRERMTRMALRNVEKALELVDGLGKP